MVGLLLIGSAVVSALLLAAAARLPSLAATLLVAYLAFVANLGIATLVLSPSREVTRGGLTGAELISLAGALACWWFRGRPGLPLAAARTAAREVSFDPLTALFLIVVLLLLAYELVLALTVPVNNGDSLAYHLPRAAAWAQHGGIYWIANAPTVRMNAFQPLAEQQILFLFVASGGTALFALPQYLAELAILVAVYGTARRLGFETRAAACSAFLLATFSLVVLEATTAQNDLVAAAFPVVAACLLLGESRLFEPALAGVSAGFGLGVKLTTVLVLPVLVWLALVRGRRSLVAALLGAVVGLAALGSWGYVLNAIHSGHLLGAGTAQVEDRAPPSYPGSVANVFYLMYATMDLSVLSDRLIHLLALAGLLVGVVAAMWALRQGALRRVIPDSLTAAIPFLAPVLVIGAGGVLAFVARRWGFPVRGAGGVVGNLTRAANEDYSAFGPLGIVALLVAIALTVWAWAMRRADVRQLAFASALPSFVVLMAAQTSWNAFLTRFLLVPAVLTAPLLARLFRRRAATAAYLAVAAVTGVLTLTHDQTKPLAGGYGRPWDLTQVQAIEVAQDPALATAVSDFDRLVPAHACVGAVLGPDDAESYLLFGPRLEHHVVYLSVNDAVLPALADGLFYVVISGSTDRWVAAKFRAAGWPVRPLGRYWLLAYEPHARTGTCLA